MLNDLLRGWHAGSEPYLVLQEVEDEVQLRRQHGKIVLTAHLTSDQSYSTTLQSWLRLGHAGFGHFQGALAQSPASGALLLLACLPDDCSHRQLLDALQALLNQRDVWRATLARISKPMMNLQSTALSSRLYSPEITR